MQVRTDSRVNGTAKNNTGVNYFLKNATSGNILNGSSPSTIKTNLFHHYLIIIQYQRNGDTSKKLYKYLQEK